MRLSPCLTALVLVRPTPLLVRPTPLLHTRVRRLVATEEPIADFAALASRIAQVRAGYVPDSKAVILRETLVPGQRLRLTAPPPLVELFTRRDGKPIVLLGQQGGKQQAYGVEATLEGSPEFRPVSPVHPEGTADICIAAGRVCEVLDSDEGRISVSRQATIRWIDLDDTTGSLPTSNPSASPPPNTTGSLPTSEMFERSEALEQRVQEWLQMVRSACRERTPTHLEDVMADLGPMPEAQRPNARAYVAARLPPSLSVLPSRVYRL